MFNKGIFNKIVMDTFDENDEQQPIDDAANQEEEMQVNDRRRIKINDQGHIEAAAAAAPGGPAESGSTCWVRDGASESTASSTTSPARPRLRP